MQYNIPHSSPLRRVHIKQNNTAIQTNMHASIQHKHKSLTFKSSVWRFEVYMFLSVLTWMAVRVVTILPAIR